MICSPNTWVLPSVYSPLQENRSSFVELIVILRFIGNDEEWYVLLVPYYNLLLI